MFYIYPVCQIEDIANAMLLNNVDDVHVPDGAQYFFAAISDEYGVPIVSGWHLSDCRTLVYGDPRRSEDKSKLHYVDTNSLIERLASAWDYMTVK